MARELQERLRIRGRLVALTPLHVGGLGSHFDTDLPLARDGQHRLVVPGTSLAGAMRAWCEMAFPQVKKDTKDAGAPENLGWNVVKALWGLRRQDDREAKEAGDDAGHASYILIEDARVELPNGAVVEVRDHVGIDRVLGAASERIKFDRAVLPRGTTLHLMMEVELPKRHDVKGSEVVEELPKRAGAVVGQLLRALQAGEIGIGAARTRGLGRVKLEGLAIERFECGERASLLALLRGDAPEQKPITDQKLRQREPSLTPQSSPRLTFKITWVPVGPLMVKAGFDGMGVDSLPLTSAMGDGRCALVLPGSSVKGALRGRAELIVRTVLGAAAGQRGEMEKTGGKRKDQRQRFIDHLQVPLVRELFGTPGESAARAEERGDDDVPDEEPLLGRSALAVDDCYASQTTPHERWREVIKADFLTLVRRPWDGVGPALKPTVHVAIDRWTGGAADQLLYSVLEPHDVGWEVLRLDLDLARVPAGKHEAVAALLLLTLQELVLGRLPLGFGTMRGMGALSVEHITVSGQGLGGLLEPLNGTLTWGDEKEPLASELAQRLKTLREPWLDWITEARQSKAREASP